MPSSVSYSISTDSWSLAYQPEADAPGDQLPPPMELPDGDWTAFASAISVDPNSGIGLSVKLESGELLELLAHNQPPPSSASSFFVQFPGRQITLRVMFRDGVLSFSYPGVLLPFAEDMSSWTEVASITPASPVIEVGVVLRYDRPDVAAGGMASAARVVNGVWQNVSEDAWLSMPSLPTDQRDVPTPMAVSSTSEPLVHAIIGAQFGDLEFDVGKSVRWTTWFCDNIFVLDVNLGTPRYWIVNWAETFPDALHAVTSLNYFVVPTEFRKEQWNQYKLAFGEPSDDDWILFIDAHEGLSLDNRSLPDDYNFAPFKSFLWREIQRAQDNGESSVVLPYYVFLRSDNITNVTYPTQLPLGDVPPVLQALSVPYYKPYQGLRRLWNAKDLKDPSFDWNKLDVVETPSPLVKAQILSYGYAHWNLQDIEPPATQVEPLTADNDDGWRMRTLLSRVRPVPALPLSDTWIPPSSDPTGLAGPWSPADANAPDPIDPDTGLPLDQPVPADPSLQGLVTPLYDCVFRINMRDGVWYEAGVSGNIPLKWDDVNQMWITEYDPALWADTGVKSWDAYYTPATP